MVDSYTLIYLIFFFFLPSAMGFRTWPWALYIPESRTEQAVVKSTIIYLEENSCLRLLFCVKLLQLLAAPPAAFWKVKHQSHVSFDCQSCRGKSNTNRIISLGCLAATYTYLDLHLAIAARLEVGNTESFSKKLDGAAENPKGNCNRRRGEHTK